MSFIDFGSISLITAILIFAVSGVVVWYSGIILSKLADQLSEETGLGRAFVGALLLGGITSLPEVATTITASFEGDAGLAVSNILGGVSMQVTILAVVDFWLRKQPISTSTSNLAIMLQGICLIFILSLSGIFVLIPSTPIFHIGVNSILVFILFLLTLYFNHRYASSYWLSYKKGQVESLESNINNLDKQLGEVRNAQANAYNEPSKISVASFLFSKSGGLLVILSLLILVAGYFVVKSSEVLAEKTGIGTNFAGLVLVAITTSLPEISTTLSAVKLKKYDMAFSNIFGTNLFDVSLIFLADLFYMKGPVFAALDNFTVIAVFLGIILTTIYLAGLSVKSKKQILGVGYDSLIIIITYLSGIFLLYNIKD